MNLRRMGEVLRWIARVTGLVTAAIFFVFLFGEGSGPRPSAREAVLIALLIAAALALFFAWRWEKHAGLTAAILGSIFFLYCAFTPGMHKVWFLGVALAVPGLLFAAAGQMDQEHSPGR